MRLLARRRGPAGPDPLGEGVWRRAYEDCASATRRLAATAPRAAPEQARAVEEAATALLEALPRVHRLAVAGAAAHPSVGHDLPSGTAGVAAWRAIAAVRRTVREVEWRAGLVVLEPTASAHQRLLSGAVAALGTALEAAERSGQRAADF